MVKWNDFVAWLFFGVLGYLAWDMNTTLKSLSGSVNDLNKNVAVVVYQASNHEQRIITLERAWLEFKKK